ncbi:MAG TPA: AgmX/PglI C-terminal domain-containing protein [Polyangia bacterium]|nr:AgmX/PglI C-terminal domain-containing protein [Polyangia bacterium]
MRCPSCDAEIVEPATFCGRCGTRVATRASDSLGTATLGALVAPGARRAKVAGLLLVDAALLGAGGWFILQYLTAAPRAHAVEPTGRASAPPAPAPTLTPVTVPAPAPPAPAPPGPSAPPVPLAQELPPPMHRPSLAKGAHKRVARVRPVAVHTPKAAKPVAPPPAPPPPPGMEPAEPLPPPPTDPAAPPPPGEPAPPPEPVPESSPPSPEEDGVRFVVQHHLPQVQACYQRALKQAPELRGIIDLQFTVEPDGSAVGAHAIENTTGSEELAGCLVRTVESWTFPRPVQGPTDFVYPFRFAGSGP